MRTYLSVGDTVRIEDAEYHPLAFGQVGKVIRSGCSGLFTVRLGSGRTVLVTSEEVTTLSQECVALGCRKEIPLGSPNGRCEDCRKELAA